MRVALGDLRAATQANPNAGTYYDINCPTGCYVLGNVLDMSILGQECWPCHNTCPSGTVWDTTALACSGTPATTNPVVPATVNDEPPPTPTDCTTFFNEYFNPQCGGSEYPLIIGGALVAGLLLLGIVGKVTGR